MIPYSCRRSVPAKKVTDLHPHPRALWCCVQTSRLCVSWGRGHRGGPARWPWTVETGLVTVSQGPRQSDTCGHTFLGYITWLLVSLRKHCGYKVTGHHYPLTSGPETHRRLQATFPIRFPFPGPCPPSGPAPGHLPRQLDHPSPARPAPCFGQPPPHSWLALPGRGPAPHLLVPFLLHTHAEASVGAASLAGDPLSLLRGL